MHRWTLISNQLPPENIPVLTKIEDSAGIRNETVLIRQSNLWFLSDMSMYVYYTPTHWSYISNDC